jgi:hypothetical protein
MSLAEMLNVLHSEEVAERVCNYLKSVRSSKWEMYVDTTSCGACVYVHTKDWSTLYIVEVEYLLVTKEYCNKDNVETPFTRLSDLRAIIK